MSFEETDLARRAAAGEGDAQFAYGRALLSGERAAVEGPRAIGLIEEASGQGHADAAAMCAVFEAMGAARPQSWSRALDQLLRAAELGSDSAQGQLLTLVGGDPANRLGPKSRPALWSELRSQLSPEQLLAPPPPSPLSDTPRIRVFDGFATAAECRWVISRTRDRLKPAMVFETGTGDQTLAAARSNSAIEFQLQDMDLVIEMLRARISAATRLPVPIFEPTQILHYAVGQEFRPHHDFLDPDQEGFAENLRKFGQRIGTFLIYLNDEYTGGETIFPRAGVTYRGRTGDALFFANVDRSGLGDPLTLHAGTPPLTGEKWVFSQWIRDRAPAAPVAAGATGD